MKNKERMKKNSFFSRVIFEVFLGSGRQFIEFIKMYLYTTPKKNIRCPELLQLNFAVEKKFLPKKMIFKFSRITIFVFVTF